MKKLKYKRYRYSNGEVSHEGQYYEYLERSGVAGRSAIIVDVQRIGLWRFYHSLLAKNDLVQEKYYII